MNERIEYLGHVWMLTPKHFNSESEKNELINERHYCKPVTKIACYFIVTIISPVIWFYSVSCDYYYFFNLWRFFLLVLLVFKCVELQCSKLSLSLNWRYLKFLHVIAQTSYNKEMTEVLTKQARRSHWHCFYAVLWLTYWWLYQRQMQKETAEGEVPLMWIKTQRFKIFNHPIFVSSDVHSSSHFDCASDHMWFKCYNKRKKEKKAEAVRTILCRSIAPFLHACVCVCISSLLKESQRLSSCLHNQEHDSKDVEWNPSNNIVSVFLSSKWSKMYEMNSHTDKERKRERETKYVS